MAVRLTGDGAGIGLLGGVDGSGCGEMALAGAASGRADDREFRTRAQQSLVECLLRPAVTLGLGGFQVSVDSPRLGELARSP